MHHTTPTDLDFDVFAASFYLLTEYAAYTDDQRDQHHRYLVSTVAAPAWQLDRLPLVHVYAKMLADALSARFPDLKPRRKLAYRFRLTWDIDHPWKYRHRRWVEQMGGFAKDLLKGNQDRVRERWQAATVGKDPFDTFTFIERTCPPEHTWFFFLLSRNSKFDGKHDAKVWAYRSLIERLGKAGYHTGIHPGYDSSNNFSQIAQETHQLADIIQQPVKASRQHFLKYQLPTTRRSLINIGIEHDFTPCLVEQGGFPHGMAEPFPWFDLQANKATTLQLVPTMIMDRTLQQYMGLTPEQALEHVESLLATTRKYGGMFTLLAHNDSLSESEEWVHWRPAMLDMLKIVQNA
ncbi:DUF7033 domain-containing protein [Pontibacter sp. G13]|uniref:DUF7033 domain-containing protein n=1 Tax=Pontibacter sp. G13 TaxID=3074898 RepID=UPI002888FDED|nr:hypothetical protein [Pontibacter sp. G13]WNJ20917.1 hypothetical protein RJD25_10605 [Pontibacter sp. G13]